MWILFTGSFATLGGVIGYYAHQSFFSLSFMKDAVSTVGRSYPMWTHFLFVFLGALLGGIVASLTFRRSVMLLAGLERVSLQDKLAAGVGLLFGLVVAALIGLPFAKQSPLAVSIFLLLALFFAFFGVLFARSMKDELLYFFPGLSPAGLMGTGMARHRPKLLDASIIIDGRVYDIFKTGFLEGPIFVPRFILEEVNGIASSNDEARRARGRRGLQVLEQMQKEFRGLIQIHQGDEPSAAGQEPADSRLVQLARDISADIITNDFGLHKIAELQGVNVLNVNQLAVALKPAFLPGEGINILIAREGKERKQGVGYLDDGTMVVVENAADHVGSEVTARVDNWYQTSAGKMLFANLEEEAQPFHDHSTSRTSGDSAGGGQRRKTGHWEK
jgi:uncharacterized protein YacL